MTTTCHPTDLSALVADLDRAVRSTRGNDAETLDAVCAALRPALTSTGLLLPEQRIGDPSAYRSHVLHVAPDGAFSLVALVWLPGQATAIHDHLSWCVVGVHEGAEHETRYRPRPATATWSSPARRSRTPATSRDCCLRVTSTASTTPATTTAISLHVYGADLSHVGSSIRRVYPERLLGGAA